MFLIWFLIWNNVQVLTFNHCFFIYIYIYLSLVFIDLNYVDFYS